MPSIIRAKKRLFDSPAEPAAKFPCVQVDGSLESLLELDESSINKCCEINIEDADKRRALLKACYEKVDQILPIIIDIESIHGGYNLTLLPKLLYIFVKLGDAGKAKEIVNELPTLLNRYYKNKIFRKLCENPSLGIEEKFAIALEVIPPELKSVLIRDIGLEALSQNKMHGAFLCCQFTEPLDSDILKGEIIQKMAEKHKELAELSIDYQRVMLNQDQSHLRFFQARPFDDIIKKLGELKGWFYHAYIGFYYSKIGNMSRTAAEAEWIALQNEYKSCALKQKEQEREEQTSKIKNIFNKLLQQKIDELFLTSELKLPENDRYRLLGNIRQKYEEMMKDKWSSDSRILLQKLMIITLRIDEKKAGLLLQAFHPEITEEEKGVILKNFSVYRRTLIMREGAYKSPLLLQEGLEALSRNDMYGAHEALLKITDKACKKELENEIIKNCLADNHQKSIQASASQAFFRENPIFPSV